MTPAMTPRQRVQAALNHALPDRVPLDLGSANDTGISMAAYRRLQAHLGLAAREVRPLDWALQTAVADEDLLELLAIDTRGLAMGPPDGWRLQLGADDAYEDEWGVVRRRPPGGLYYDVIGAPFAEGDPTPAAVDAYRWPDATDAGRFRGLRERARFLHEQTDYAIVLQLRGGITHQCTYLRGFADFYADLLLYPLFADALLERCTELFLEMNRRALQAAGDLVDVVFVGDDLAGKDGPLISLQHYRRFIKPRQRRIFDLVRSLTSAKLAYHTCGAVTTFLDDLIEIGVDVLNPVQVSAAGMDTCALKRRYGAQLAFWGGIDTQYVLPRGSQAAVRAEVKRRISDLGTSGGYVLGSVHNIQPDVPPENICAMFEAARAYGSYGGVSERPF